MATTQLPDYSLLNLDMKLPELSAEQQDKLADLSTRVADLTSAGSIRTDPSTLLRYLRARKYNVAQADKFLREAAAYRQKHDIDGVCTRWNLEAYQYCLEPWWLSGGFLELRPYESYQLGHARDGTPVAHERLGRCNFAKLQTMLTSDQLLKLDIVHSQRCIAALEEDAMRRAVPLKPILIVMDLEGFGWDQVNFKAARSIAALVESRCMTLTEITGKVLVVNAPQAFTRAWSLFKHLLDEGTRAKVEVVARENTYQMLLDHIDEQEIPAYLGGLKHINGDPECREVLAPGGLPPPAALARFAELLREGGSSRSTERSKNDRKASWRSCCG